ncbi:MAG: hypothetical protein IBJ03_08185 [Gemmatimonadaceae bacterium]|nr:hypothetical protein [Gemmatimonadaceae bacterium]
MSVVNSSLNRVKWLSSTLGVLSVLGACGGGPMPSPAPTPTVTVPDAAPAPVRERRVALPMTIAGATWRVTSRISLDVVDSSGNAPRGAVPGRQQVESQGLVTWSGTRNASGALTLTGQVDSFTVRASFDQKLAPTPIMPALLLLDGRVDSTRVRVVPRPVLENECDRPEAAAAALAAELLVRIPEGVAEGASWRDSTVSIVCRSGLPMTLITTTQTTLENLGESLRLRRVITQNITGTGGSPFRALDVKGSGQATQRIELDAQSGVIRSLEGSSDLTLTTTERAPQLPPRVMNARQRGELRAQIIRAR